MRAAVQAASVLLRALGLRDPMEPSFPLQPVRGGAANCRWRTANEPAKDLRDALMVLKGFPEFLKSPGGREASISRRINHHTDLDHPLPRCHQLPLLPP